MIIEALWERKSDNRGAGHIHHVVIRALHLMLPSRSGLQHQGPWVEPGK